MLSYVKLLLISKWSIPKTKKKFEMKNHITPISESNLNQFPGEHLYDHPLVLVAIISMSNFYESGNHFIHFTILRVYAG